LIPGQALHAKTLGFEHPITNSFMQFDSNLAAGFQEIIQKWEKYTQALNDL
jgi:23S rRNA pseudouridine1911/1915/1917 synthase